MINFQNSWYQYLVILLFISATEAFQMQPVRRKVKRSSSSALSSSLGSIPAHKNIALLIDADNTSPYFIRDIIIEMSKLGSISIKRCYGDFSSLVNSPWKAVMLDYGIVPVQQFAYTTGKGSTDIALCIDAMDLLYTRNIDAFAICSSDSDFTRLAGRLREGSKIVYGVGRRQTPTAFRVVCNQFIYIENLEGQQEKKSANNLVESTPVKKSKGSSTKRKLSAATVLVKELRSQVNGPTDDKLTDPKLHELLETAYDAMERETEAEWVSCSRMKECILRVASDFDERTWNYSSFLKLARATGKFEFQKQGTIWLLKISEKSQDIVQEPEETPLRGVDDSVSIEVTEPKKKKRKKSET